MAKEQTNELWFHLWSPIQGLANLSVNDDNKVIVTDQNSTYISVQRLIVEAGAVESVVQVLDSTTDEKVMTDSAHSMLIFGSGSNVCC